MTRYLDISYIVFFNQTIVLFVHSVIYHIYITTYFVFYIKTSISYNELTHTETNKVTKHKECL